MGPRRSVGGGALELWIAQEVLDRTVGVRGHQDPVTITRFVVLLLEVAIVWFAEFALTEIACLDMVSKYGESIGSLVLHHERSVIDQQGADQTEYVESTQDEEAVPAAFESAELAPAAPEHRYGLLMICLLGGHRD